MSSGRDNEAKAARFMEDGEKCLTKWSLFGSSTKFEDAAELFEKAGRLYKVSTFISQTIQSAFNPV